MSTSKERVLRIVRLESELRAVPDEALRQQIDALPAETRALLNPWCPPDVDVDVPALRGSLTRGRLKGVPERVADALTAAALQDCIDGLGDRADFPSESDLGEILPSIVARHGVPTTRIMLALAVVTDAPASKAILKSLKTDPSLAPEKR